MRRLKNFLFSTRTMAVLLFIYAISMAIATFIESDFDTPTAKALVYDAKWFEILMLWLIVLFIANIKRYRLLRREKWPVLIFHLSFVFIFLGGTITRYISFEGQMPIKKGETTNEIISDLTYFKVEISDGLKSLRYDKKPYSMSYFNSKDTKWPFKRTYEQDYAFDDKIISLKTLDYIPMAQDSIRVSESGKRMVEIVSMGAEGRVTDYIADGEIKNIGGTMISFNKPLEGSVQLLDAGGELIIVSPFEADYISMAGQQTGVVTDSALLAESAGKLEVNKPEKFKYLNLYTINNTSFIISKPPFNGEVVYYQGEKFTAEDKNKPGVIVVELTSGVDKDTLYVTGGRGLTSFTKNTTLNGLDVTVGFGSKIIETPFSIRCDDFIMETYPGSNNPSQYESELTIIDNGKEEQHVVYMNNVLDYRGYRFFQASYFPDQSGTILSVNADWWGTNTTYLGYFMLFFGMFATLFWKGTRFWDLNKQLTILNKKKLVLLPFLFSMGVLFGQNNADSIQNEIQTVETIDSIPTSHKEVRDIQPTEQFSTPEELGKPLHIDLDHANQFGHILVQDFTGRIKPMNTHTLELMRKIHKKDKFINKETNEVITSEQWFLSMQIDPATWADKNIISVSSKAGDQLLNELGVDKYGYTNYLNLIDINTGRYKLEEAYNQAFSKRQADQSKYDKEVINVTERFNIFNNIIYGYYTTIIPIKNDIDQKWTSWIYSSNESPVEIDEIAYKFITQYFNAIKESANTGDWTIANEKLKEIDEYQHEWGKNVMPSPKKVELEVFYNKANVFFWLMIVYSILGFTLVILAFIEVVSGENRFGKLIHKLTLFVLGIVWVTYGLHIVGLGIRWYLSGHAPWSNGYEAIVFISSVGVLSGLILYRNRNAFIPAAGALVAMIMMGFAHGGSMLDPQITPLAPVLKSYWLMIHVGIITSSYGFFGLSTVIAIIALILISIKPTKKIKHSIREITIVSEMSLTIGIFALTVGTFLGGMWANESWGRYWSWDPKETWSFISVMIYAIVLHMRLVPGLRGTWAYNVATLWAIWTIIFTYFGVNYYLEGLHSYAAGDPIPIPNWIYYTIAGMLVLTLVSYFQNKKYNPKKKKKKLKKTK